MGDLRDKVLREADQIATANPEAVVVVIDLAGIILYQCPNSKNINGVSPDEAIGRQFSDFFSPEDSKHLQLVITDLLLTGVSILPTRTVINGNGERQRMRGGAQLRKDEHSGETYILSVAHRAD